MIVTVSCLYKIGREVKYNVDDGSYQVFEFGKLIHDSNKHNPYDHPKPHHLHTYESLMKIKWGVIVSVFNGHTFPNLKEWK